MRLARETQFRRPQKGEGRKTQFRRPQKGEGRETQFRGPRKGEGRETQFRGPRKGEGKECPTGAISFPNLRPARCGHRSFPCGPWSKIGHPAHSVRVKAE